MSSHQDWDVVILRKRNKANPTDNRSINIARREGMLIETKAKQLPPSTIVNIKKLDENQEDFHHKHVPKDLACEIIRKRVEKNLTQAQLAKSINEQTAVIQEIESGKAIYNPNILNKVYRVLGIQRKK